MGENCSEEDEQYLQGYCSTGSLCQPNSRSSLRGDSSSPFCFCPLNQYGDRCSVEQPPCLSSPCLNNGSCLPGDRPNQFICLCRKDAFGHRCDTKKWSIHLCLSTNLSFDGAVIQFFEIDLISFDLLLVDQNFFQTIPNQIDYYHPDRASITAIVLAKLYSSNLSSLPDLHLLSVRQNISSLHETTHISSINQCEHRRTFLSSEDSSPIRYHQLCIANRSRLCFRDDVYLCLCVENHQRAECFLYDDDLDRCEHCLADERCLQGNRHRSNGFLCLNSWAHPTQQWSSTPNSSPSLFTIPVPMIVFHLIFSLLTNKRTILYWSSFRFLRAFCALSAKNVFSFINLLHSFWFLLWCQWLSSFDECHISQLFLWVLPCPMWSMIFVAAYPPQNPGLYVV